MKNLSGLLLVIFITLLFSCVKEQPEVSEMQVKGLRTTSMEFMKTLKGVLINQMQTKGVVEAVAVCSDTAQVLTNNFGINKGVFIRRVSLRNRNENNYPDGFEKKALSKFELLKQNNELNETTEHYEVVRENDFTYLRYIKPILVQAECLNCHGSPDNMMPEVKKLISQNYPNDKAIGYVVGDLRGAVSVKKVLE